VARAWIINSGILTNLPLIFSGEVQNLVLMFNPSLLWGTPVLKRGNISEI